MPFCGFTVGIRTSLVHPHPPSQSSVIYPRTEMAKKANVRLRDPASVRRGEFT